jgi:hypothetical protein
MSTMKTYAEGQGKEPFDWSRVIDRAIKQEPSDKRWSELADAAGNWVTCACGAQCSILPRDHNGYPLDSILEQLGTDFFIDVDNREWKSAKKTLDQIEARSAILIAEELAKKEGK